MRAILVSLLCLIVSAAHADSLDVARQLAQAGAQHLALARVVRDQPSKPDAPNWFEWESLRFSLLSETHRPADLIQRVKALPRTTPRDVLQRGYGHAAWAHLELGEGAAARRYLAQLLWKFDLAPDEAVYARRLVVRSYLVEHRADEAYRAMLRYKQDYAPLKADVAEEFARGLLAEGRNAEALTWLPALDPAGAAALQLNLRANFVSPEEAAKQARLVLQKTPDASDYGTVLIESAEALREPRQHIAALEQVVNGARADQPATASRVAALWRAYAGEAEAIANRLQLLKGDDAAWFNLALQSELADPVGSRALYAYLTQQARAPELRDAARVRLFRAWVSAQWEGVAIALFSALPDNGKLPVQQLEPLVSAAADGMPAAFARSLRHTAGRYAETQGQFALAADYYTQVVLAGDFRETDTLGAQAFRLALSALDKAGLTADGAALSQYVANARTAAKQAEAAEKPAAKPKRKKK